MLCMCHLIITFELLHFGVWLVQQQHPPHISAIRRRRRRCAVVVVICSSDTVQRPYTAHFYLVAAAVARARLGEIRD